MPSGPASSSGARSQRRSSRRSRRLRAAAEKAERREGLQEADRLYERALELVDDEHPETAVELRLRRGRVLAALGRLDEAVDRFRIGRIRRRALGRRRPPRSRAGRARKRAPEAGARRETPSSPSRTRRPSPRRRQTRSSRCRRCSSSRRSTATSQGEARPRDRGGRRRRSSSLRRSTTALCSPKGELRLGFALLSAGELEQAEDALARSAEIGSELGSRRDESRATFLRAVTAYHRGRPGEAERLALEAQDWFERTGDSYFRIQNLRALATYALARGDAVDAERRLATRLELAAPSGGWLVSDLNAALAELLARLGRVDEAEAAAEARSLTRARRAIRRRARLRASPAPTWPRPRATPDAVRATREEALEIHGSARQRRSSWRGRGSRSARRSRGWASEERASAELRLAGEQCARMGATTLLAEAEIALSALDVR